MANRGDDSRFFNKNDRLYLTRKEFCFLAHIGLTKLREEVRAKRIKTHPIGLRGVRIHRDELLNWPRRCRGEQIPGEE
jgi:hypothetical protein